MQTKTTSRPAATRGAQAQPIDVEDLYTVERFVAAFPMVTEAILRHQIRHREHNGLAKVVIPFGNKLVISRSGYERWLGQIAGTPKGQKRG